ncbi:hypothetical protein KY366_06655 [Candidatus Woesearchaeota archaeon]|nr:hypothetical protein [Candidatus Woesearchaeota archaeon]
MEKELVTGFFIGVVLYTLIFGARVIKVLVRARWNFSMIRHGISNTFNDPRFVLIQVFTLALCTAGSITLYYFYKKGYFFQK